MLDDRVFIADVVCINKLGSYGCGPDPAVHTIYCGSDKWVCTCGRSCVQGTMVGAVLIQIHIGAQNAMHMIDRTAQLWTAQLGGNATWQVNFKRRLTPAAAQAIIATRVTPAAIAHLWKHVIPVVCP